MSNSPTEHEEQKALFYWARLSSLAEPRLKLMFAIPNGGHRHISVAKKMKAEGVKKGVPDIFLPVRARAGSGLWIEMKRSKPKGKPTAEQIEWLEALRQQGFRAEVCWGWSEARAVINDYLGTDL